MSVQLRSGTTQHLKTCHYHQDFVFFWEREREVRNNGTMHGFSAEDR